ncbi:unnamed protein product [Acanthoscelides obtectus]|uniref:Uncharacterized protein n=1 Tax=Acanthoscelides obtectus TaxID=200917 RepID=A0A9P0LK72_ACAOB|nr:unnamed protein product [Acanthoscelides obtectus]CAK1632980.1 hypothetical protein AOBTE_LOCUS7855 [Acanthoscelides obtectus]
MYATQIVLTNSREPGPIQNNLLNVSVTTDILDMDVWIVTLLGINLRNWQGDRLNI